MTTTATPTIDNDILERLAVDLDPTPTPFDDTTVALLTDLAGSDKRTQKLATIMNDEANTRPVRSRAMNHLTAELIRARARAMMS